MSFWDYLGNTRGEENPFTALMDYAGIELPKERLNPTPR